MKINERIVFEYNTAGAASPFLAGAETFAHPDDVLSDPHLTKAEKKALLASWCSDARAVENAPALRRLDSGAVVEVEAILQALVALDEDASATKPSARGFRQAPHRASALSRWLTRARSPKGSNDNDDDPPPAPAGIAIPFRPSFVVAHAARPEILGGAACAAC